MWAAHFQLRQDCPEDPQKSRADRSSGGGGGSRRRKKHECCSKTGAARSFGTFRGAFVTREKSRLWELLQPAERRAKRRLTYGREAALNGVATEGNTP
ncbi:hypothetical protein GN956_G19659 [Arapaima gigas]